MICSPFSLEIPEIELKEIIEAPSPLPIQGVKVRPERRLVIPLQLTLLRQGLNEINTSQLINVPSEL